MFGHFKVRTCFVLRASYFGFLLLFGCAAHGQVLRPIDPTKQADINSKSVNFDDTKFQTLTPGMRRSASLPLSGRKANVKDVNLSEVELKSLNLSSVPMKTLPQQNFTAKRATFSDRAPAQKQLVQTNAPITSRQIYPFKPGGDEELKKQLNTPR